MCGWKYTQHNYDYIPHTIFSLITGCRWVWSEHLAGSEVIAASSYKIWLPDFFYTFWCTISKEAGNRQIYHWENTLFSRMVSILESKYGREPLGPPNILSKRKKKKKQQMLQIYPAFNWERDIQGGGAYTPRQSVCLGMERQTSYPTVGAEGCADELTDGKV